MAQTVLKSKSDEKDVELLDYIGAINQLVSIAKKDLEDVKNQILLENVNLMNLKERIIKQTNEFERWKKGEEQKFKDEMNTVRNDILAKQNMVNQHVQQQERITQDLNSQHQRFESLNADKLKLKEELVKIEGQKIQAQDMINDAVRQLSESKSAQNQANMLYQEALAIQEKNKQENIRLSNLNGSLESRAVQIEESAKNLANLKEFVEPKLRSIKEEQDFLNEAKEHNQTKINELLAKIDEEKIILKSLVDRKAEVEKAEKELESKKEEFSRQQILNPGNR
jgi:chromosome segregation ATPase